jgi:hypothetical protein
MPDDMLPSVAPPNVDTLSVHVRHTHEHRHHHKHEHRSVGPKASPSIGREMHRERTSTNDRDRAYTQDRTPIKQRPIG